MNRQELIDSGVPPEMAATFGAVADYLNEVQERRHMEMMTATIAAGYLASVPPGNRIDAANVAKMAAMVAGQIPGACKAMDQSAAPRRL